jgi:hypothetical protein
LSLGLNLVLALFILAPGLATLAGIYRAPLGRLQQPPPAQASFISLTIVVAGALIAHTVAAIFLSLIAWANSAYCSGHACLKIHFDTNPYIVLMQTTPKAPSGGDIAVGLLLFTSLSVAMYFLVSWAMTWAMKDEGVRKLLYGWLADVADVATEDGIDRYVTVFVVTDMESAGKYLGYEGLLESMAMGPDKEVQFFTLTDVATFVVNVGDQGGKRKDAQPGKLIGRMYFAAKDIKNLAFEIFEVEDDTP